MGLETGTYISDLNASNPTSSDAKSQGDDHLRLIKSTLKNTFPNVSGAVTPTHTELNYVDGVTSAIQTQLDAKAPLDSPALTGAPTAPTAASGTSTTQIATTAFVAAAAFNSSLPSQTGNSGKFVTTDGTNASWSAVPLASGVSGVLPAANGGTGLSSPGTSGNVLTSNGSAWVSSTPAAAYTMGTPIATTSGTVAEFTGIPFGAKQVVVNFEEISFSNTSTPLLQLGTSTGYVTSGYVSVGLFLTNGGTTTGAGAPTNSFLAGRDTGYAASRFSGCCTLSLINQSTNSWSYICIVSDAQATEGIVVSSGSVQLSGGLYKLKVYNGTFDGGYINIMYV